MKTKHTSLHSERRLLLSTNNIFLESHRRY